MKKHIAATEENRRGLKKKMMAALAMLMVAVILTVTVTYAWLILSVSPEVRGISTTIGANGSLEVALLNNTTYSDPDSVPTVVGVSLSNNQAEANYTWGNMVDLNDPSYGLQDVVLYPSRLNVSGSAGNYTVGSNGAMLLVPTYGADGRITQLTNGAMSGTYTDGAFRNNENYGVRAIGTANSVSVQGSALINAKKAINTSASVAVSSAKGSLSAVDGVQEMLLKFAAGGESFTEADINVLKEMIGRLQNAEDNIETALRQGLVAAAASALADETTFETVRTELLNTSKKISALLDEYDYDLPENFVTWVDIQEDMQNDLTSALALCNSLDPVTATKADIKDILDYLMNLDQVLVGDKNFSDMTKDELINSAMGGNIELTLKPGSGIYADIADFVGNYNVSVSMVTIKTVSPNTAYLSLLSAAVSQSTAAGGGSASSDAKLEDTFGYVLDLGFRSNAARSDLLLQTTGAQRVYADSSSDATMGGGSYMEFSTAGDMDIERLTKLMNAVRVAFVDDSGNLLGIAKLNVSNRQVDDATGNVKAPLYLYDFTIGTGLLDNGQLIMGERQKEYNVITSLERDEAKVVSTLVWLDGDTVDNTMVSAETNLVGVLNLQFASSVDLVPAGNSALMGYITNKDGLEEAIADIDAEYISQGQGEYTTVSWIALTDAYDYAASVANNDFASDLQVYNAILSLQSAEDALAKLGETALDDAITRARKFSGQTDANGCLVAGYDSNGMPVLLYEYTQEQKDNGHGFIKAVDDTKNTLDGGGQKYTTLSWNSYAHALYYAEAVKASGTSDYTVVDYAITQLTVAEESLDFATYFTAYEYTPEDEATIYYKASSDDPDTYGKWYTIEKVNGGDPDVESFDYVRVTSELLILELDAYAVKADVAWISGNEVVPKAEGGYLLDPEGGYLFNASVDLHDEFEEIHTIEGVSWTTTEALGQRVMTASQYSYLATLLRYRSTYPDVDYSAADALEADYHDADKHPTYAQANNVIYNLCVAFNEIEASKVPIDMTEDQVIVLNKAILNAQSLVEANDPSGMEEGAEKDAAMAKWNALKAAIANAQSVLVKGEPVATYTEAQDALDALNEQIAGYDASLQATEYNTILYTVPEEMKPFAVPYMVEQSTGVWMEAMTSGNYTMTAKIITDMGVLYECTKEIQVYDKAEGITVDVEEDVTMNVGGEQKLFTKVDFVYGTPEKPFVPTLPETIKSTTISTSDSDVLEWTENYNFKAKAAGTVYVYVTVETVQGNTYTTSFEVTIS